MRELRVVALRERENTLEIDWNANLNNSNHISYVTIVRHVAKLTSYWNFKAKYNQKNLQRPFFRGKLKKSVANMEKNGVCRAIILVLQKYEAV